MMLEETSPKKLYRKLLRKSPRATGKWLRLSLSRLVCRVWFSVLLAACVLLGFCPRSSSLLTILRNMGAQYRQRDGEMAEANEEAASPERGAGNPEGQVCRHVMT